MSQILPPAVLLGAYLIGSIPFSYLVARFFLDDDIRLHGSGNVGATNVARSVGKRAGLLALLLDILKGWGATILARAIVTSAAWPYRYEEGSSWTNAPTFWIGAAALLAVVGHIYPVWLGFRGGKGVATAAGVYMAMDPRVLAAAMIVFALVVITTRYVSLGSMMAAASVPIWFRFLFPGTFWMTISATAIAVIVILKHHTNIARLARGEERKFPR